MRKWVSITLFAVLFLSGISAAAASVQDNCTDCHHVDFQAEPMDRSTVCKTCHSDYGSSGHPAFQTTASINADFESLHVTFHRGESWGADTPETGCLACHDPSDYSYNRKVYCKACHINVAHENHTVTSDNRLNVPADGINVSVAGGYLALDNPGASWPNKYGYKERTLSCTASKCHGTYWQPGGIVKKPACTNCHTDVHGTFPSAPDDYGVQTIPNSDPAKSDITIKWFYQSGDTLLKSFDGLTWTTLTLNGPVPSSYYTYTDPAIANWSIVYYKIKHAGGSERYFPVYPPGSNAHTNYMDNTKMCAFCHVTHSAQQATLLKEQTIEDLCRTCHGLSNSGSRYNVDTGETVFGGTRNANGLITAVSYRRSNAGAFGKQSSEDGKYYAGESWGTKAEVTSTHTTNSAVSTIAPGGGHNGIVLTCTSCHRSHPKKNAYRMLGTAYTSLPSVSVEAYAVNPLGTEEKINYIQNMNVGCGCHQEYIVPTNSGHTVTANYFRHAVGVAISGPYASTDVISNTPWNLSTTMPTEYKDKQGRVVGSLSGTAPAQYVQNGAVFCLTCHYAHGTVAKGQSKSAYDRNGDTFYNDYSTMLRRGDNNTACENCHKR